MRFLIKLLILSALISSSFSAFADAFMMDQGGAGYIKYKITAPDGTSHYKLKFGDFSDRYKISLGDYEEWFVDENVGVYVLDLGVSLNGYTLEEYVYMMKTDFGADGSDDLILEDLKAAQKFETELFETAKDVKSFYVRNEVPVVGYTDDVPALSYLEEQPNHTYVVKHYYVKNKKCWIPSFGWPETAPTAAECKVMQSDEL